MSYHIVKSIKISGDKVMITGSDNNVRPRTPHEWECKSLGELLKKDGREALDIAIMKDYESGDFQSSSGKYARALQVLRHMPEYAAFDWRGDWEESKKARGEERKAEFEGLLIRALHTKLPATKYAITKEYGNQKVFMKYRKNAGRCQWAYYPTKATVWRWEKDAQETKKWFTNSENWEVVAI